MKKTDKTVLIEGLRTIQAVVAYMADQLEGAGAKTEEAPVPAAPVEDKPVKAVTREDVRAILAEKSRSGFRAEVKALLTEFGAEKLSDITEPEKLVALAERAEVIGSA